MPVNTVPANCKSPRSYKLNQCLFVHVIHVGVTALNNLRTNALTLPSFSCLQCRQIKTQERKCTNPFTLSHVNNNNHRQNKIQMHNACSHHSRM